MDPAVFVLLSGALTFGVPLAIAVREWIVLRRGDGGSWRGDPAPPDKPAPRPLPDCLIPKLSPHPPASRPTVRELA